MFNKYVEEIVLQLVKLANSNSVNNWIQSQHSYQQKYLDIVVNKNDIAVLDSVDGIIGNLHLAGEGFLWVPFDGFPNHFIQAVVTDFTRGVSAVHDFLL